MRQATEALMRERRCTSETAEPTVAGGTASKVCAEVAAAAQADEETKRVERAAKAQRHNNSHTPTATPSVTPSVTVDRQRVVEVLSL
eukprot:scaffold24613_cov57-Phaeocystis_antarctica.AAC.1